MVNSSCDHSSGSSEEHSNVTNPKMKISADARAKVDQSFINAGKLIHGRSVSLDHLRVVRDKFSKRKAEDEKLAAYQQKWHRLQQARLATEDEVQARTDGVASDSDAEEVESVWKPIERRVNPYPPGMRAERLPKADFRAECEEDEYLDAMYDDLEDQLEEVPSKDSDNDSEEEHEEDSMEDYDLEDNESDD